jgi:hypothetical protein
MHSWRSFFDLLGLPLGPSLVAYSITAALTATLALVAWRARGPLALRFSALVLATILIDPHMWVYDFILITPACLLIWDWLLMQDGHRVDEVLPAFPIRALRPRSVLFVCGTLVYICYFSPLLSEIAEITHLQISVLALSVLLSIITGLSRSPRVAEASAAVVRRDRR